MAQEADFEWNKEKGRSNLRKHGMDPLGRTLVVAYTWRGERIRLVSARPATRAERRRYQARARR